uniref:NADH-ubiquinone oxidoreductase chain 4L n=1 Tax=Stenocranus matsumurai TaxID=1291382 RepID=A0A7S4YZ26_9HEMI|nr:NADH dehydrogenase subunit 4L [Stenocranus matsumurai]
MFMNFFYIFFFNVVSLFLVRKHYLLSLISLEFIFIILFNLIFFYLNFFMYEYFYSLIFLILSVCEGAMGLSLLVYMVRKTKNLYLDSFSLC